MKTSTIRKYSDFIINNRDRVNRYLNNVLWVLVITGPAIAAGVAAGIFPDISYTTCIYISAVIVVLASVHLILRKKLPDSPVTSIFALTALDALLVYMSCSHVSVHLTWFIVPLLSLLFCEKYIYLYTSGLSYILMCVNTWLTAPYYAALRTNYESTFAYFIDSVGGLTIEMTFMFVSGYMILRLTTYYFKELFRHNNLIREQEAAMQEKMDILNSMVEIYDNVNLLDFTDNTEMSLRSAGHEKHGIDMTTQTHTLMNQVLQKQVLPDHLEAFLTFTNIKTVRSRLANRKIISADFIDVISGWFRAQYITVDATPDGIPNIAIYVTRNVDEEKRREEHLVRISMTDELTRLYNRRSYEEDLSKLREHGLDDSFVLFSIDVNGLKRVNDTKGHAAGDELIKGAADCLSLSFGNSGKVYRTGGDEFMAVTHTGDPEALRRKIKDTADGWHGIYTEELTISVGYAAYKDTPAASVDDLEHRADKNMYAEKERYYKENGIDRRKR